MTAEVYLINKEQEEEIMRINKTTGNFLLTFNYGVECNLAVPAEIENNENFKEHFDFIVESNCSKMTIEIKD